MMKVRPFALLENSLLRSIERRLGAAAAAWGADWGVEQLTIATTCQRSWDTSPQLSGEPWSRSLSYEDKQVWFSLPPELPKYVQRQIFPTDKRHVIQSLGTSTIALEGAQVAIKALITAMAGTLGMPGATRILEADGIPDPQLSVCASGAVLVVVKIGEQSLKCLINYACVKTNRELRDAVPLEPLKKVDLSCVFSAAPVSLKVTAGQVDVDVGNFMTLALGDVIRLPTSIDKPLKVLGPDEQVLFEGHLGALNKSMAIEVVPCLK